MRSIKYNDDGSWSIMDGEWVEIGRFFLNEKVSITNTDNDIYEGFIDEIRISRHYIILYFIITSTLYRDVDMDFDIEEIESIQPIKS